MRFLVRDFDGTLGYRVGRWSSALHSVLEEAMLGHHYAKETLSAHLQRGFPWHSPAIPHPKVSSPTCGGTRSCPSSYGRPRQWRLFDDMIPALRELTSLGWTHLILSNHVPELPEILQALELDEYLLWVFNSAESGHEKPRPRAFDGVLETIAGAEAVWMVGDNPEADVRGAEAVGLPAILVRVPQRATRYHRQNLSRIADIVERA